MAEPSHGFLVLILPVLLLKVLYTIGSVLYVSPVLRGITSLALTWLEDRCMVLNKAYMICAQFANFFSRTILKCGEHLGHAACLQGTLQWQYTWIIHISSHLTLIYSRLVWIEEMGKTSLRAFLYREGDSALEQVAQRGGLDYMIFRGPYQPQPFYCSFFQQEWIFWAGSPLQSQYSWTGKCCRSLSAVQWMLSFSVFSHKDEWTVDGFIDEQAFLTIIVIKKRQNKQLFGGHSQYTQGWQNWFLEWGSGNV